MLAQLVPPLAALATLASAHGVILAAQGEAGSPPSVGFQVNDAIARNCTTINPCQMDTTIIRDAEIAAGTVNSCGRTKLTGNIDVGEATENALAAKAVTQVKAGTQLQITIHQVNADGAGPYFCDLDESSNTGVFTHNLTVTNNVPGSNGLSQVQAKDFNITVALPDNLNCFGASTGNVCTVRCRNNAQAGPFGGCFAVQQTDNTPLPAANQPSDIKTEDTLDKINFEVASNQAALPAAVEANRIAGGTEAEQNRAAVEAILKLSTTLANFPTLTPTVIDAGTATPTPTPTGGAAGGNNNGTGNGTGTGTGNGTGRSRGRTGRNRGGNAANDNSNRSSSSSSSESENGDEAETGN
ncbi:hypothetical protein MYCTH_2308497 [Thermothelomyces thermophilus ATCC 42464]|uniref:GEgh 16 protein n=1 Tax=Thermothelomyces thermophilus (strain ATCC 42464 / BCRC 31852 / DSM 1799) TaxID=573729 RepID=G2QJX3_THET4|nr:uncharacterized protein MYCTH_2308497 [Thermothelomyces thermophilus ATCC 42464]AEO59879.1 hypothetical protein MYCTH_2308497 [Thermothelomyces thermophilus ATCC 42464]